MKFVLTLMLVSILIIGCESETQKPVEDKKEVIQKDNDDNTSKDVKKIEDEQKTEDDKIINKDPIDDGTKKTKEKIAKPWKEYKAAKSEIKLLEKNEEFLKAANRTKELIDVAKLLDREDILAWQYNNVGYNLIKHFRAITDYDDALASLNRYSKKEGKANYLISVKKTFTKNIKLLEEASKYLDKAKEINAPLKDDSQKEIIISNINFINWVQNFIKE